MGGHWAGDWVEGMGSGRSQVTTEEPVSPHWAGSSSTAMEGGP